MGNPYVLRDSGIGMTDCLSKIDKIALVTLKFTHNTRSEAFGMLVFERKKVGQSQRRFEHYLTGNLRGKTMANS